MISTDYKSLAEVAAAFADEAACIEHLERIRWPDGIVTSPFDPVSKIYRCAREKYRCRNSGKYFNAKTGTIFYNTKVPLQKWFMAIWLVATATQPITSVRLAEQLHLTQKTAWYMLRRIKNHLGLDSNQPGTGDPVQDVASIEVVVEQDRKKLLEWLQSLKK